MKSNPKNISSSSSNRRYRTYTRTSSTTNHKKNVTNKKRRSRSSSSFGETTLNENKPMAEIDMIVKRRRLNIDYDTITTVDGSINWDKSIGCDERENSKVHVLPLAGVLGDDMSGRRKSTAIAMDECECHESMNWNENQSSNLVSPPATPDFRKSSSSSFAMTSGRNGDEKMAMDGNGNGKGLLFRPAKKLDFTNGVFSLLPNANPNSNANVVLSQYSECDYSTYDQMQQMSDRNCHGKLANEQHVNQHGSITHNPSSIEITSQSLKAGPLPHSSNVGKKQQSTLSWFQRKKNGSSPSNSNSTTSLFQKVTSASKSNPFHSNHSSSRNNQPVQYSTPPVMTCHVCQATNDPNTTLSLSQPSIAAFANTHMDHTTSRNHSANHSNQQQQQQQQQSKLNHYFFSNNSSSKTINNKPQSNSNSLHKYFSTKPTTSTTTTTKSTSTTITTKTSHTNHNPPPTTITRFVNCSYCDRPACCTTCTQICENCHGTFCKFCYTTNYDDTLDRYFCLDCNNNYSGGDAGCCDLMSMMDIS